MALERRVGNEDEAEAVDHVTNADAGEGDPENHRHAARPVRHLPGQAQVQGKHEHPDGMTLKDVVAGCPAGSERPPPAGRETVFTVSLDRFGPL